MNRPMKTKDVFWAPSLSTARAIGDSDVSLALEAANYRFRAALRDLETAFEQKACELRASFVKEVSEACGEGE